MTMVIFLVIAAALVRNAQSATNVFCTGGDIQYVFSVQHNTYFQAGAGLTKIPFNLITRNDENVYNTQTNEFTAPIKGVYFFHFSAASFSNYMAIYLVKESTWISSAVAGVKDSSASNMIQIELNVNEKISVQLYGSHAIRACNSACATFDGRLLYRTA